MMNTELSRKLNGKQPLQKNVNRLTEITRYKNGIWDHKKIEGIHYIREEYKK